MAGITREQYMQYAKKIVSVLSGEQFYNQYRERVKNGANSFKLQRKKLIQEIKTLISYFFQVKMLPKIF